MWIGLFTEWVLILGMTALIFLYWTNTGIEYVIVLGISVILFDVARTIVTYPPWK